MNEKLKSRGYTGLPTQDYEYMKPWSDASSWEEKDTVELVELQTVIWVFVDAAINSIKLLTQVFLL